MKLPKVYDPKKVEDKIYKFWLKTGFFNPDKLPKTFQKKPKVFTIVLPPPNVTGELHMGHALNATVQDILIRWKRLQGFKTLWLPGTDHAGIATQVKVEKELKKEGLTRFQLGREKFLERVFQWKEKYGNIILEQFKKLGCSCDWSRTRFTMDKDYVKAVETAFLAYYKKGRIYLGERPINWCPRCQTSLSDLELEYREEKGNLWYIKYPLKNNKEQMEKDKFILVATTRPETMLGDTAVAVNPKDERYKNLVGEKAILPLVNREIPIISDKLVDPRFGSGAVKVTPAHNLVDYEIAIRHQLPIIKVIDENGKITDLAPEKYQGLNILEAREKILKELESQELLWEKQPYSHSLPVCYRCGTVIEVLPSKQWFLKMKELAKIAEREVKSGRIKFYPKRFEKTYFDWLRNIKDWCISRQIWWGHKIPLEGVEDVLDTWFSSALWPFAALGWPRDCEKNQKYCRPKKNSDLAKFYPTDVLSTGRDIINLWVARMIFSAMEFMGKRPFKKVFIHPTVLTKSGERMSKSLGTGIDPLDLISKYGADATRFGLSWQVRGNQDIRFTEDNIIMGRKFCNKIWNAARFVMMQIDKVKKGRVVKFSKPNFQSPSLTSADKKILMALRRTIKSVNRDLENFRFGQAAEKIYNFFWHDFCDIYIEKSKIQLENKKTQTLNILLYVLINSLILLHPFMPFITEEIFQKLPIQKKKRALIVETLNF